MMKCDYRNCEREAHTCGNVITYDKDGNFETICLCKRHLGILVPKRLRDFKEENGRLMSVIPPEEQIRRLEQMIDVIKDIERREGL